MSDLLYIDSPFVNSPVLTRHLGNEVFLKLDSAQPSGSFKIRGISVKCQRALADGCTAFVSSSGGNAGLAVAHSGRVLGVPVTVVVPETTAEPTRQLLRDEGATVLVHGAAWDDANDLALKIVAETPGAAYVHPFDDPIVWQGHSFMIDEIAARCAAQRLPPPSAVVMSVGGGGLMVGVLQGMHRAGWKAS
eukprot:TRINITY_DN2583_c0_g1_i1.p1 TRINITY_DN2583_c0_g1~~TRINITY_DN2583_c0_g1_i1.p1  ORF type:complete len:207 (-),score=40.13 TRINITY_DN2583_c0_g1_i1:92-664(-)